MSPLRAVTFDLWDTLLADDSDEPKRKARGLLPKHAERRRLVGQALGRHGGVSADAVACAYDAVDAAFRRVWHHQHVTWTVRERFETLLEGLGRKLPEEELADLVQRHEEMELVIPPEMAPGARQALEDLSGRYRLGVVSDTVFTPGRLLREILKAHDLFTFFDAFAFSDEVGRSKPHPAMFEAAADLLGVAPGDMLHVGDRESNDVDGPHRVGARAILYTGVKDRRAGASAAEAVCEDLADLARIVDSLDAS